MEHNQIISNRDTNISLSEIINFQFKPQILNIQSNEENIEEDKKRYYITPPEKSGIKTDSSPDIDKSKRSEIALQNINTNIFNSSTKLTKTLNFNNAIQISDTKKRRKKIFKIIYPKKKNINDPSSKVSNNLISIKRKRTKKIYKGTKCMDNYNIKAKILTHFFNQYIFASNDSALKKAGCELFINKFPRKFILSLISKKGQNNFFQWTLEEIYNKSNYKPNLDILRKLREDKYQNIMEQSGFGKKLETKISELYKEYLNSDKFNEDIEEYKETIGNAYVNKYLNVANNM